MAGLRWQLYRMPTEGHVHLRACVLAAEGDVLVVRTLESSVFPPGSRLRLRSRFIPSERRTPDTELNFTCAVEKFNELFLSQG